MSCDLHRDYNAKLNAGQLVTASNGRIVKSNKSFYECALFRCKDFL